MSVIRPGRLLPAAVFLMLSCSDPTAPRTPTSIAVVSGSGQNAVVATALPQPIVVEVKDAGGKAIRGATVTWTVSGGGGTVSAGTTPTDGSGRAQVQWTLGTTAGENRLNAAVGSVAPTAITAIGLAGAPATAEIASGSGQSGVASEALAAPLQLRVRDVHGNGVPSVGVTFLADGGTATPSAAVTNEAGVAQTTWTLGPLQGPQTLDATVTAIGGAPVRFTAIAATDQMVVLQNDVPVTGLAAPLNALRYYRLTVPAGAARLTVTTTGGGGGDQDADLFVRHGTLPSTDLYDCRSIDPSTVESCVIQAPNGGEWFIMLHAFSAYSNVTLRATYVVGGSLAVSVTGLPAGASAGVVVSGPGNYTQTLTASGTLSGIDPGSYTVTGGNVLHDNVVYIPAPESQTLNVTAAATTNAAVAYAETSGGLNLDITGAYITQAVQRTNGSIPLIAGRGGLLRVFARSNALNTATPAVRARFFVNGTLVDERTISAPTGSVPVNHDESVLVSTWNVSLPGSLIQPGLSMLVDIDPTGAVAEADETDNNFPANATPLGLDVRTATTFQARLVPVRQTGNNLVGDVTASNLASYTDLTQALYPLPGLDADIHATYTFTGTIPNEYNADDSWGRLLNEIRLLRVTEGSTRYYYGVIKPGYTSGGTGLGYIGHPAAIGVDVTFPTAAPETMAHEWGHNFGRQHVDCGGPANPDPDYPYAGGILGHHGYDMRTSSIRSKDTHFDLMSYCGPTWSSDYTYEAVLSFRAAEGGAPATAESSLLVWGRISPDGVVLEPSFEVVTRPVMPTRGGRYRLTGTNAKGKAFEISFDGYEIDHMPGVRHFAYAIPLRSMAGGAPTEMRLQAEGAEAVRQAPLPSTAAGPGGEPRVSRAAGGRVRLQWDAARNPVVLVRDARTGEVLSFARGGDAEVATTAAEVEINMSDGVRSSARKVVVPR